MGFTCYPIEKFNRVEPRKNKWSIKDNNYGICNQIRDSRNISGVVGIFFFSIMMILFIVSIETKRETPQDTPRSFTSLTRRFNIFSSRSKFCQITDGSNTTIECTDVNSSVMKEVQEEINNFRTTETNSISFVGIEDPVEVIKPNWLSDVNIKLHSFAIKHTDLEEIKSNSFKGRPFEYLTELIFSSIGDFILNDGSFSGLSNLYTLSFQGPGCHFISAEERTLENLNYLSTLQITDCSLAPKTLKNMTGGEATFYLQNMSILDLQQSSLGKLLSESFTKIPNLVSLYLQRSNLGDGVEATVFKGIHPQLIDMDQTKLTKFPEGVFDNVVQFSKEISLRDVYFDCSCDFKWFQDFYRKHDNVFVGNSSCCDKYHECTSLESFQFCVSPTPSTTTLVTSTHEMGTTGDPPSPPSPPTTPGDHEPTHCLPANRSYFNFKHQNEISRVINLGKKNFRFTFTPIGNTPHYRVSVDSSVSQNLVLLFKNQADWILCLSDLEDNFIVENLDYGETYTICIMESGQRTVSPRSCQSLTVPEEWGKQSWINNNQKLPALIAVSSTFILTLLSSVFAVCCYVKRNPNLVYGKDNVIVVERENSKKYNNPVQNYEQPNYPPSLISWSDGYLTPKVYESVEDFAVPCIDQRHADYLERPRIYPPVRLNNRTVEELETAYSQSGGIYESVNYFPTVYYMNEEVPNKAHKTL